MRGVKLNPSQCQMRPTKTLNVDPELHKQLDVAATVAGVKLYHYVEAALQVGMRQPDEIRRLLEERTSSGPEPEPRR